jgi:hypothetical protein
MGENQSGIIHIVAEAKFHGLTPLGLSEAGDDVNAQILRLYLGIVTENHWEGEVQKKLKTMQSHHMTPTFVPGAEVKMPRTKEGKINPDILNRGAKTQYPCGCTVQIDRVGATHISACGHDDCERERIQQDL